jgi:hypothetical protein
MVKTTDGKLYALDHGAKTHDLRNAGSEKTLSITGRVKEVRGISYLEVTSFREL